MKPIRLSDHARRRALLRGASEEEVKETVARAPREPARRGKWQARSRCAYGGRSPIDGRRYGGKTVEVVFAEESDEVVVVTVKVYYAGREDCGEN